MPTNQALCWQPLKVTCCSNLRPEFGNTKPLRIFGTLKGVHTCKFTAYRNAVTLQVTDTIRSYDLNFHHVPYGVTVFCERYTVGFLVRNGNPSDIFAAASYIYSGPSSYDRLDIRTTWVTTKILVLTYDQILSYESFSLSPDTRVFGRNSGQCSALYN
jgi:hypothetical protein